MLDQTDIVVDGEPPFRIAVVTDVVPPDLGADLFGLQFWVIEGKVGSESTAERLCNVMIQTGSPSAHNVHDSTRLQ